MKDREGHKVPRSFPKEAQRRDFRKINNLEDIDGAQPSHKRSTFYRETQRITNPLNPQYVELDGPVQLSPVLFHSFFPPCGFSRSLL